MKETGQISVTGATGFVGSAVARALLAGRPFRCARWCARTARAATSPGSTSKCVEGDLRDRRLHRPRDGGRRCRVPCRRRLSALGPRPGGDPAQQSRRHAQRHGGGASRRASSASSIPAASPPSRRVPTAARPTRPAADAEAEAIGAYKRSKVAAERLVEEMVAEQGLPAVIVNPSTPIGPRDIKPTPTGRIIVEAATGRMPGFVDTGAQPRPCRRRGGRPSGGLRARPDRRALYPGRRERVACARCWPRSPGSPAAGRRRLPFRAGRSIRWPGLRRGVGALHRARALRHPRRAAHGEAPHGLHLGQGRARAGLPGAALSAKASPMPSPGFARRDICDEPDAAHRPRWRWPPGLYLLVGRGGFWRARERDDGPAPAEPAGGWPVGGGRRSGAQRGRRGRRSPSARCCARIIRARSASSWWTTRAATAPRRCARAARRGRMRRAG